MTILTVAIGRCEFRLCDVSRVRSPFGFPDAVDETSARVVATGVVAQAVAFLVFREGWLFVPLAFGFLARVLTGPTLSPLGRFAVHLATPLLERRAGVTSRRVPGPPKRFAQGIGLVFTASASIAWLAGASWLATALTIGLVVAASLEAFAAVCLGCIAYSAIWGCADCDDIAERLKLALARSSDTVTPEGHTDLGTR